MKLRDLQTAITTIIVGNPAYQDWDVVSLDCIFDEMFISYGAEGEYIGLGQQLGPQSPRADFSH